jgi:two-component system, sensor histidine kinase ChiS
MRKKLFDLINKISKRQFLAANGTENYYNNGFYQKEKIGKHNGNDKASLCNLPGYDNRFCIWILEQDKFSIDLMSGLLEEYKTKMFIKGDELLDEIKYDKPDLILVNPDIEDQNGFKVCKQLRKNYSHYELPVIFITSKKPVDSVINSFNVGVNDIIYKPIVPVVLYARIRMQLMVGFVEERYVRLREFSSKIGGFRKFENMVYAIYDFFISDRGISDIILLEGESIAKKSSRRIDENIHALLETKYRNIIQVREHNNEKYVVIKNKLLREYTIILKCYKNPGRLDIEYLKSVLNHLEVVKENIEKLTNNNMSMHIISEIKMNMKKLKFIKSESPYCLVCYKGKKDALKRVTLSAIKLHVGEENLVQIHKQILVNPKSITKIEGDDENRKFVFIGNDKLPIGKTYRNEVLAKFQ